MIKVHTEYDFETIAGSRDVFVQVFKLIQNTWPDEWGKCTHFFWSLGGPNNGEIEKIKNKGEDYWIIDTGYLSTNVNRYPKPDKVDVSLSHFRFSKNSMHNNLSNVSNDDTRLKKLQKQNIWYPTLLDSYEQKEPKQNGHLLIAPSSHRVSKYIGFADRDDWVHYAALKCKKYSNKPIAYRFKKNPSEAHFPKHIRFDLEKAAGLVTSMSMAAIDAVMHNVPILTHPTHVCAEIAQTEFSNLNNLKTPTKEELKNWMCKAANCQFSLDEIKSGEIYEYIK